MKDYGKSMPYIYRGVEFYMTCCACPEQYDAWIGDRQVAYVRLRWGMLRAYYPDVGGKEIYSATINDDGWQGCFTDDEEKCYHLCEIAENAKRCVEAQDGHC